MTPSSQPQASYISDVAYPPHFNRETMPTWLVSALASLGRCAPDITRPYTWLEMGCGSGLGVVVAAATNPLGHFIGLDIDPQAIALAKALARTVGVTNVSFHCVGFENAAVQAVALLPSCDFVVTHGVYSWVDPASRNALRQIAASRLSPGGVFYLAYMSQPGAGVFDAAHRLMRQAARRRPGSSADKARAGQQFLRRIADSEAGYFKEHPAALREVSQMAESSDAYLAHEYLNAHRDALHVADVMADMAAVDFDYAGSATLIENIDAISLPESLWPLMAELRREGADVAEIETFKDIARNQNLRRDIYQRRAVDGGTNVLSPQKHRAVLLAQRLCLLPSTPATLAADGELVFDTRIGPVRLALANAAPLLNGLQDGPRSYAELARLPAYAAQPGFVSQLLHVLTWAGWLHPVRPDSNAALTASQMQSAVDALDSFADGPLRVGAAIGSACIAPWLDLQVEQQRGMHDVGIQS